MECMGTHRLLCTDGIHTQKTLNCQLVCPRTPAPAGFFSVWCPETTGSSPGFVPEDSDSHVPQQLAVGQRGPKSESYPALAQPELLDELLGLPGNRELQPLQGRRRIGDGWCGWMHPSKLQPHSQWPFSMHPLWPTGFPASLHPLPYLCLAWSCPSGRHPGGKDLMALKLFPYLGKLSWDHSWPFTIHSPQKDNRRDHRAQHPRQLHQDLGRVSVYLAKSRDCVLEEQGLCQSPDKRA